LCTHDPEILARAKAIRNFGQLADGDCEEAGINAKLTEVCALIGIEQLKSFEQAALTRRRAVARMREGLAKLPGLTVAAAPHDQDPIWLYLPVFVDEREFGLDRDDVAAALAKENLYVRKYYSPPCHHMRAYTASHDVTLPRTEASAYTVLALPVYNDMTEDECDGIAQAFLEVHHAAPRVKRAFG
ncbi:MAG TPA: DegT/DnrJ/EryC1/StrS family aminotransferase, partial [Stellaceae bacterium]|nr:DegT/DnrJ/EryC1/StrS family aminotransferase [Stellaceae bacterium]